MRHPGHHYGRLRHSLSCGWPRGLGDCSGTRAFGRGDPRVACGSCTVSKAASRLSGRRRSIKLEPLDRTNGRLLLDDVLAKTHAQSTEPVTFYDRHPFDWIPPGGSEEMDAVVSPPLAELIQSLGSECAGSRYWVRRGSRAWPPIGAASGVRCIGLDRSRVSVGIVVERYQRPGSCGDNLCPPFCGWNSRRGNLRRRDPSHRRPRWVAFGEKLPHFKAGGPNVPGGL